MDTVAKIRKDEIIKFKESLVKKALKENPKVDVNELREEMDKRPDT